ncbi:MarR family transcriptional regulator [Paeniglutamicibacter sp. Y32M11]|nr:MarR family transcriptional regulator [Paeniglutamicibacter sp. Y32M11]
MVRTMSTPRAGNKVSEKPLVDPLALENQVCFALSLASRSVIAAYRPVLEPLGLTHPQYLVMLTLWEHEPLSIKELSNLLQLDPGTLSPLVKRIEALGFVQRSRSVSDERTLEIVLTPKGREARVQALEIPKEMMRRLDMDADELALLHRTMKKVIAAAANAPH